MSISTAQSEANKLTLASFLEKTLGFTPAGAAGFLGNTQAESGFNPAASGTESNGLVTMGFQQWEGGRRTQLQQLAAAQGKTESDIGPQEQMIYNELTQSYPTVLAAGRTATNPATYANIVNRVYENSGDYTQNRENFATAIYAQISQPGALNLVGGAGSSEGLGGQVNLGSPDSIAAALKGGVATAAGDAASAAGSAAGDALSGTAGAIVAGIEAVGKKVLPFFEDVAAVVIGVALVLIGLVLIVHAGSDDAADGNPAAATSKVKEAATAAVLA